MGLAWQPSLFGDAPVRPDVSFASLRRIRLDDDSWVDHAPGWLEGEDRLFDELLQAGAWRQRERWMYDRQVVEPRLTGGFATERVASSFRRAMEPFHPPVTADALRNVAAERVEDLTPGADAGTSRTAVGLPASLAGISGVLGDRYGVDFDSVWINLYRDGSDSVAWHGDRNARTQTNPMVVTVSLGARRRFLLRPKGGSVAHRLDPGQGDLVVMGGACQQDSGESSTRKYPDKVQFSPGQGDLIVMGGACQHTWEHCVPKTKKPVQPRMSVTIRHSVGVPLPSPEIPPADEW